MLEQAYPEMGAIRFHAYENEVKSIRSEERKSAAENENKDTSAGAESKFESDYQDPEDAEANRLFCNFMAELQKGNLEWKGKLARPTYKNMSLHARATQNAGLVEQNLKCFAKTTDDPHYDFRECLKARFYARDKTDEEKAHYKRIEDDLMADPLRKSGGVITTLSQTTDNKLKERKKLIIALIGRCLSVYGIAISFGMGT